MGIEFFEYVPFGIPDAMWQPTWSPHPPPGAQGAPLGQPAGTMALPPQGVQPHAMVAQPMNQQWMGNHTGSQGCPGNSPTLGPSPFYGPGPPGQGFVVQCKHHQGCYSIMQHQQPMLGTTSSSSPPPMGFGLGSQQAGYQGTTWSPFPTSTPLPQQVPQQHQLPPTHRDTIQAHYRHLHLNLPRLQASHPSQTNPSSTSHDRASKPTYLWLPAHWLKISKVHKVNQLFQGHKVHQLFKFLNFLKVPLVFKVPQALQFVKILKLPKANNLPEFLKLLKIPLKVLLPSKEYLRHRRVETNP